MKNLFLFSLFICLPYFSIGQTIPVDSFYISGASWLEAVNTSNWDNGSPVYSTLGYSYKIERDTMVSGTIYHLMSAALVGTYVDDTWTGTTSLGGSSPPKIFAMIRVDSNKVYFTLLTTQGADYFYDCDSVGHEYLLYDFNLEVGSVVPGNTLESGIDVSTIDSVSLSNGSYVKRYNDDWVYGIGAQEGFINYWSLYICDPGPDEDGQYMLCYNNPHFYYHFSYPPGTLPGNLQYTCFDFNLLQIASPFFSHPSALTLYPNPATSVLTISATEKITTVTICNTLGQTMYDNQYNSSTVQVDVSGLPDGVYFIKVNGTEARKFVKQ